MIPYKNISWESWVVAYIYNADSISVKFKSWTYTIYTYTYDSAGMAAIEIMKKLADSWHWLNSYISSNKPKFQSKK